MPLIKGQLAHRQILTDLISVLLCDRLRSNTVEQRGCYASSLTRTLIQYCDKCTSTPLQWSACTFEIGLDPVIFSYYNYLNVKVFLKTSELVFKT